MKDCTTSEDRARVLKRAYVIIDLREQKSLKTVRFFQSCALLRETHAISLQLNKFKNLVASVSYQLNTISENEAIRSSRVNITVCQSGRNTAGGESKLIIIFNKHDQHSVCVSTITMAILVSECVEITRLCLFNLIQEFPSFMVISLQSLTQRSPGSSSIM